MLALAYSNAIQCFVVHCPRCDRHLAASGSQRRAAGLLITMTLAHLCETPHWMLAA